MNLNSPYQLALILAAFFLLSPSVSLTQSTNASTEDDVSQRADALFTFVQEQVINWSYTKVPCLSDDYPNSKSSAEWLKHISTIREQGEKECTYNLLDALESDINKTDVLYKKWMLEKAKSLYAFGEKDSSLVIANQLIAQTNKQDRLYGWAKLVASWCVHDKTLYEETLNLTEEALAVARNLNDKLLEVNTLMYIGKTIRDIYIVKPEKNVPFYEQALDLYTEMTDTSGMIRALTAIGVSYDNKREQHKMFDYAALAIELLNPQTDLNARMYAVRMLAIHFSRNGDPSKAIPLYEYVVRISSELHNGPWTHNNYMQLAGLYMQQKNYEKAFEMMDSSEIYLQKEWGKGYFYSAYAEIAEASGNKDLTIDMYKKAFGEQTRHYIDRNSALLTETETKLRTHETALLLKQERKRKWMLWAIIGSLAALFGSMCFAFFKQRAGNKLISEQKLLIENQAEELRHLDRLKSNFFTNVSHELRTPLTLMLGPISSTIKSGELNPKNLNLLEKAQSSGKDLFKLIKSILDLSKMESGKIKLNEQPELLFPLVRRIISSFESLAQQEDIHLTFLYRASDDLCLDIDKEKLETILNNLLYNAIKFTPQGGKISVEANDKGDSIVLKVTDTGRGIPADDLPNIFNRYYQSKHPDINIEGGAGIGLAITHEFVKLMGGNILVQSELGNGSEFVITLPRKEVITSKQSISDTLISPTPAISMENRKNGNGSLSQNGEYAVLIVEDNYSLRDYLSSILGDYYRITTAKNGQIALDHLAQDKQFDLILTDIMMPVMNGFQLLENLKTNDRTRHIPSVVLTARAEASDKLKALRIGVDDYLLKPFEEEELLARIQNLLQNSSQRKLYLQQENPETPEVLISEEEQVWLESLEKTILEFIGDSRFNTDFLGEQMNLSRRHLQRRIKKITGMTPKAYINQIRMTEARRLLETGQVTNIQSLANEVGFANRQYFSKFFKERFGKLPSEYLK